MSCSEITTWAGWISLIKVHCCLSWNRIACPVFFLGRNTGLAWVLLLYLLVDGCGWPEQKTVAVGINRADYKEACGKCHALPKPKTRSDSEWDAFLQTHTLLSGLDSETSELYADYLKRHN